MGHCGQTELRDRLASARIPDRGVLGTYKKLEKPDRAEGFGALYYVRIDQAGSFDVQEWADEV